MTESVNFGVQGGFRHFLFSVPRNRIYLSLAALTLVIQFVVFKYFYPFPSFITGDSFNYLFTARNNGLMDYHAIGYAKFLRLLSVFITNDKVFVAVQYLILEISALGFMFTLIYFYKPGKGIEIILLAFFVFNPAFLFLANMITSDGLFISLSFVWLTLLIWIMHCPSSSLIVWHAIILFFAFTVRYNALYYLFISLLAYLLSPQKGWAKFMGVASGFLLISWFYLLTIQQFDQFINYKTFTPASGWQLANNALYAYEYIDSAERKPVPANLQELDNMVRHYLDSSRNLPHVIEELEPSSVFMFSEWSPLVKYKKKKYSEDTSEKHQGDVDFYSWAEVGPALGHYGAWLIQHYPLSFLRHFLLQNALKYYTPPTEWLGVYSNRNVDTVQNIAVAWFHFKSRKVGNRFHDNRINGTAFYPVFCGVVNVFYLICVLCFFFIGRNNQANLRPVVLLTGCLWLLNFSFSIFAAPIHLRYQVFPIFAFFCISLLVAETIYKKLQELDRPDPKTFRQILSNALSDHVK
jgi:hypothetical protein